MTQQLMRLSGQQGEYYLRDLFDNQPIPFNTRDRDVVVGVTKPSLLNTGVLPGSTLTKVSGDQTFTEPGVYRNLDFHGTVRPRSMGVEFYNCRFRGGTNMLDLVECTRPDVYTKFVDCTFKPDVVGMDRVGLFGGNYHALRCQFEDVVDYLGVITPTGFDSGVTNDDPTNVTIEACYGFHFLYYSPDPGHEDNATHNDGVQIHGGADTTIRGNFFEMSESPNSVVGPGGHPSNGEYGQGITITPVAGNVSGVVIDKNWVTGGKHGMIAVGSPFDLSFTATDNRFGPVTPTLIDGVVAPRRVVVRQGDTAIGLPVVTGPDTTMGNINQEDGSPVTVWRTNR